MTSIAGSPRLSPELRATAFYFTLYMSAGAGTVYAGIWLQLKGMSLGGALVWLSLRLQQPKSG